MQLGADKVSSPKTILRNRVPLAGTPIRRADARPA